MSERDLRPYANGRPRVVVEVLPENDPGIFTQLPDGRTLQRAQPLRELLRRFGGYEFDLPVEGVVPGHSTLRVSLADLEGADPDSVFVVLGVAYIDPDTLDSHDPNIVMPPHEHFGSEIRLLRADERRRGGDSRRDAP